VPDLPIDGIDGPGAVQTSPHVLLVVDDDGICVEASLGACLLLAAGRDEIVGRDLGELFENGSRERFASHWTSVRRVGGRAGTFTLALPGSLEVDATVTPQLLPSRHLVALEAAAETNGSANGNGHGRFSNHAAQREPTPREREVLDLLSEGATDDQIAAMLELSPATVQSHVRSAKSKLGARTRAQAVAMALQRGLIGLSH
jgi:DNA-binding CsgD family transcriptional regulator